MSKVILFSGWYTPALCRACPDLLFVFGDNMLGFGKGGQAIIRSEPNAFGVPTKRKPAMSPGSFFAEGNEKDMDAVLESIEELWTHLENGKHVVFPMTENGEVSLGLERAKLRQKAPSIYTTIENHVEEMCNSFGCVEIEGEGALRHYQAFGLTEP